MTRPPGERPRNAAEALGAGDRLGTLEPGKLADLLVVDAEPDRDVRVLQDQARIRVVMREGRIVVDRRAPGSRSGQGRPPASL